MKRIYGLAFAVFGGLALSSAGVAQEAPQDPSVLKIGLITAMSGKFEWHGQTMSRGARQAVSEINAAGGIDGIMLELIVEDHKVVPRDAVTALNKLVSVDGVQAVLTSFSPPTLAIAPIADERGIFLLNGGGVSQAMVGTYRNLFHNRSLSTDLGRGAAAYAAELGFTSMAQLAWRNDAGENVMAAVEGAWQQPGNTVVASEMMNTSAPNIDTQVAKIRSANPDFVGLWVWTPDVGTAVRRFREAGINAPIIGVDYTPEDQKVGGEAMNGYHYVQDYFTPTAEFPWSQQFAEGFEQAYGEAPTYIPANYYEGVYVIAELIRRSRATGGDYYQGPRLVEELKNNPVFDSVYGGTMTFQANGVASKRVGLFEIQDTKPVFLKYIEAQ